MCEVNYSIPKKYNSSKYIYTNNEEDSQFFVFEITLKSIEGKLSIIRKIKKNTQGCLILQNDLIKYSEIDKIKISILDSNNIKNELTAKITIDHKTTYTTYMTADIYLELNKNDNGYLLCNYNISN